MTDTLKALERAAMRRCRALVDTAPGRLPKYIGMTTRNCKNKAIAGSDYCAHHEARYKETRNGKR